MHINLKNTSMAPNKFATMLHKNCHKIIVILIYATLEWILILLLLNSFFSHLISKFIEFFGLKPSCTLCSIFGSKDTLFDHVCGAHGAKISGLSYCRNHKRLSEFKSLCRDCSFFSRPADKGEDNRCSCCDEKILIGRINSFDDQEEFGEEQTGFHENFQFSPSDENPDCFEVRECNEDDKSFYITGNMVFQDSEYLDSDGFICIELIDAPSVDCQKTNISSDTEEENVDKRKIDECTRRDGDIDKCRQIFSGAAFASVNSEDELDSFPDAHAKRSETSETQIDDDDSLIKEHLKTTIKAQQKALSALYTELDEERKAAAIAANEKMAMITKLQQEKANIQIEALQYERMMEEQAEYDQEALQLINDILTKREKEKIELENELDLYRNKGLDHDEGVKNDFEHDSEENKISSVEFDEEGSSILEELKFLESKLFALHDNERQSYCDSALRSSSSDDKSHFNATDNELGHE